MKVYKYRGINDLEMHVASLKNDQIFAPVFDKLNDPFEGLFNENISELAQNLEDNYNIDTSEIRNSLQSLLAFTPKLGIYSLAKTYSNELLWAHYSNSHRGFCIEYEIEKLESNYLVPKEVNRLPVEYKQNPQTLTYGDFKEISNLKKLFGTKSKEWRYEEEIRLIFDTSGPKAYHTSALTGIYFGAETLEEHRDYIISSLEDKDVKFYEIFRKTNSYKLNRRLIAENKKNSKYELNEKNYEIIGTKHNLKVENFYVLYKGSDLSSSGISSFIKAFRAKYTTIKSNIKLFNDRSLKSLLYKDILSEEENKIYEKHCIAESTLGMGEDVRLYPYK